MPGHPFGELKPQIQCVIEPVWKEVEECEATPSDTIHVVRPVDEQPTPNHARQQRGINPMEPPDGSRMFGCSRFTIGLPTDIPGTQDSGAPARTKQFLRDGWLLAAVHLVRTHLVGSHFLRAHLVRTHLVGTHLVNRLSDPFCRTPFCPNPFGRTPFCPSSSSLCPFCRRRWFQTKCSRKCPVRRPTITTTLANPNTKRRMILSKFEFDSIQAGSAKRLFTWAAQAFRWPCPTGTLYWMFEHSGSYTISRKSRQARMAARSRGTSALLLQGAGAHQCRAPSGRR